MRRAVNRELFLVVAAVAAVVGLPTAATAQQQAYNSDGTPSMITSDGNFFDDKRQPGTGAVQPSQPQAQLGPLAPGPSPLEERFDIDCDPDIEVCVDPDPESNYDDGYDPQAYQQFESSLAPYGTWSEDPNYGEVWTPSQDVVGYDFEPYATDGQWTASSDYGFTWVSDYDWGWGPFHYGRWITQNGGVWAWVPGTLWGPAWVDWRYGNGYCGWSPLPPRGIVVPPPPRGAGGGRKPLWHFTLASDLTRRNPSYVPATVASSIYGRTSPVRNQRTITANGVSTRITLGPSVATLSHDIGRAVPTMQLKNGAPSVLPRAGIVAHQGIALEQRGYARSSPASFSRGVSGSVSPTSPASRPLVQGRGTPSAVAAPRVSAPPQYPLGRTYSSPTTGQPVYRYSGSTYQAPQRGAYSQPAQQTYQQPAQQTYQQPQRTYTAPTYQQPTYQQPTYQQPQRSYAQPSYQQPVYQAPSQPSYSRPAPSYQAPSAPTYQAPVQTYHPSAPAPVISRPAVSAPSYSSPTTRRH